MQKKLCKTSNITQISLIVIKVFFNYRKLKLALSNNYILFDFQIIMLSASANRLSRLKEQAEEYAALIMEELDPERLGYIEVGIIYTLYILNIHSLITLLVFNLQ